MILPAPQWSTPQAMRCSLHRDPERAATPDDHDVPIARVCSNATEAAVTGAHMSKRRLAATCAAVLLAASCGGGDTAADTSGAPTTTAGETTTSQVAPATTSAATTTAATATTTTTIATTTTTAATATTTTSSATTTTAPTVLTTIAAGAFDFAAGTSPRFAVQVTISGDGAGGPFVDASQEPGPTLAAGDDFWVQFTVTNTTTSATMTDLSIVIDEFGLDNLCPLGGELGPQGTLECVTPSLTALAGPQTVAFTVAASGFRQGETFEDVIDPPLRPELSYANVPYSFEFVFELSELEGARIEGNSNQTEVAVALPEISLGAPLTVDCSDAFGSGFSDDDGSPQQGEPRVVAFVITTFDDSGSVVANCGFIPTVDLDFLGVTENPTAFFYVGE